MKDFIKMTKGKDLSKIPKSRLHISGYYASIKYDGHYVQIHKVKEDVRFFTSGGKEFHLPKVAEALWLYNPNTDFILEAEFNHGCDGLLGDRGKSSILTSYRAKFNRGVKVEESGEEFFNVFDLLFYEEYDVQGNIKRSEDCIENKMPFSMRNSLLNGIVFPYKTMIKTNQILDSLNYHLSRLDTVLSAGYEGLYLKHHTHTLKPNKRVNDAIKLKTRPTADLLCIDVTRGEGKYRNKVGSLVLIDMEGRKVSVGSGLSDEDRSTPLNYYISKIIEISYEQILDTYIQPVFISVREDKSSYD